jgi:hypothetical protein
VGTFVQRSVALFLLVAVAGCARPPGSEDTVPDTAPEGLDIRLHAEQCSNAVLFRLVDFEATDDWLPPGFHPRDAQHFIGAPVATNQGAAVLVVVDCATTNTSSDYDVAFAAVFVEPVSFADVGPADLEFYEVERLGSRSDLSLALAEAGWPVGEANLSVRSDAGLVVAASVADEAGTRYSFSGPSVAAFPISFTGIRMWHDAPSGLGYVQYAMPFEPTFGPAACQLRAGSTFADVADTTDCLPPRAAQVSTFPDLEFDLRVRTFPGQHL